MLDWVEVCDRHGEREPCGGCRTRAVSAIRPEPVRMLTAEIPRATTTVLTGLPGVGKSTTNLDLAARVSKSGETVLILTAEDHLAAVIRPRLEAAGANLDLVRVAVIDMTFPDNVDALREDIEELSAGLVIIDPLVAFISESVNSHRDHHVRRVLAPLGHLAEETGAAVVVVVHSNKGTSQDPLMRVSGSVGFTGAARTVIVAAEDPDDDTRRIFAVVKSNLVKKPVPRAYRLVGVRLGEDISTSKVEWLGDAPEVDLRTLLGTDRPQRKGDQARSFLRESGVMDNAQPAADLQARAEQLGINHRTLRRAADELAIPKWPDGFHGGWWWGPKPGPDDDDHRGHPDIVPLSPVEQAAEIRPQTDTGDRGQINSVASVASALGSVYAEVECARCLRYGEGHVGDHLEFGEDIGAS
jgi:hypothetical protein